MTWAEAEAKFAENFDNYEPRIPQRLLATAIEDAFTGESHILAQAACGVGKSYGAMVPAIDRAVKSGLPVIAATATKALQDQYYRDMEALRRLYFADLKFTILKGRGSYLCKAQLASAESKDFVVDLDIIKEAAEEDGIWGDVDRLPVTLDPGDRRKLTMTSDECPGKKKCSFGEVCFAEGAKRRAADSHVVITNHAMLAIDATLRAKGVALLPMDSGKVIDEMHEFESYVSNALTSEFTTGSFLSLTREIDNLMGEILGDEVRHDVAQLWTRFDKIFDDARRGGSRDTTVALTPETLLLLSDDVLALIKSLRAMRARMIDMQLGGDQAQVRRVKLTGRLDKQIDLLQQLLIADFSDLVRWVGREEREDRRSGEKIEVTSISQAPLHVAPFLQQMVWPDSPVTLMSATVALGSDFTYMAKKLGLQLNARDADPALEARTFDAGTPFDFATQAKIYVPKGMPHPSKEEGSYRAMVHVNLTELVRASDGRALLLFTSWKGLNAAYKAVAPSILAMGHRVLKQGEAPTKTLADTFAADEHSVLFAVKSFFTGIDIQGDSLRLVFIDKLPFPNPSDPLFKAQCAALDASVPESKRWTEGAYAKMSVPEMAFTLLQAFGRLIRSRDDRGLVAIMDSRLHSRMGGLNVIRDVLPDAPVLTELSQATEYLHSLESEAVSA